VTATPYDVAVVGYGPVGQALSAMLGASGHRVVAVERWPELFPLPRAGHVDAEVMRIFQSVGVGEAIAADSWELTGYELRDSVGDVLHAFDWGHPAASGWHSDYSLFQPHLEALLHGVAASHPSVELLRGWQAERVAQGADGVEIDVREGTAASGVWYAGERTRRLRARYLIGADGANSIVRDSFAISVTDFGFTADWLVVFAEPHDPTLRVDMPDVAQLMDPARPTTAFRRSGKRFCRWEFMLMPGETAEQMSTPEVAWALIDRWGLTPANARLVRNTVFRFRSLVADDWRVGRAFLAGDAAHLMPPFLGQGLCSGLRDAITLSWKLDLVLRGLAGDALLDTYTAERRPHVESIVHASLGIGELISLIDPIAAAQRDARMRAGTLAPPAPLPALVDGVVARGADGRPAEGAGELSIQGRVRVGERAGRFDDIVGGGWVLITSGWDAAAVVGGEGSALLELLRARVVRVEAEGAATPGAAVDLDGAYTAWLERLGGSAVIVRPDFYVFAVVRVGEELDAALADLRLQLAIIPAAAGAQAGALAPA